MPLTTDAIGEEDKTTIYFGEEVEATTHAEGEEDPNTTMPSGEEDPVESVLVDNPFGSF